MSTGTIYVCGACGKTGPSPESFRDESCRRWAVLVYADSIERGPDGRVVKAEAVPAVPAEPKIPAAFAKPGLDFDKYNGITKR